MPLGWIGSIIGLLFFLISVPGNIGRFGLLKYKNLARYLVLLLAEFDVHGSFGNCLCHYTFWVLVQDKTVIMFTGDVNVEAEVVEAEIAVEDKVEYMV